VLSHLSTEKDLGSWLLELRLICSIMSAPAPVLPNVADVYVLSQLLIYASNLPILLALRPWYVGYLAHNRRRRRHLRHSTI
jgi:hypothetical protein